MTGLLRSKWEVAASLVQSQINGEGTHVWPFDSGFPVDVRLFVLNRRHDIPMHRPNHFELIYLESGEAVYQVQNRHYLLRKGDLVVVGSGVSHRCCKTEWLRPQVKAVVLFFLPELIRSADGIGDDIELLIPFYLQDPSYPHIISGKTGIPLQVRDLVDRIFRVLPVKSHSSRLAIKTYLKMILILLMNHYANYPRGKEAFTEKRRMIERLRPLFDMLETHYSEPITIQRAAALVGMSKSHFIRFFKDVTRQSFIAYLNHFRIAKAQALLLSTDESISEIGQEVGFCNQSYFTLLFRRHVNMTPRRYKLQGSQSLALTASAVPELGSRIVRKVKLGHLTQAEHMSMPTRPRWEPRDPRTVRPA